MLTRRTPEAHAAILEQFRKLRAGDLFTPPSRDGTIIFPGVDGGAEWGGAAFDPESALLYVNSNEMPWIVRLIPNSDTGVYVSKCATCHREDRTGSPAAPSLVDVGTRKSREEIAADHSRRHRPHARVSRHGRAQHQRRRRLPRHRPRQGDATRKSRAIRAGSSIEATARRCGAIPTAIRRSRRRGARCRRSISTPAPSAGRSRSASIPELVAKGLKDTGSDNYGGPVVTAGGLLFIGATNFDRKFHAYDKLTGKLLWETTLPAAGSATPSTYMLNGRQFVVIVAGGGKNGAPSGSSIVAFALPQ